MIIFIYKFKMKVCCGFKFFKMYIFCKKLIVSWYYNYLISGFYIFLKVIMLWFNMLKGIYKNILLL